MSENWTHNDDLHDVIMESDEMKEKDDKIDELKQQIDALENQIDRMQTLAREIDAS